MKWICWQSPFCLAEVPVEMDCFLELADGQPLVIRNVKSSQFFQTFSVQSVGWKMAMRQVLLITLLSLSLVFGQSTYSVFFVQNAVARNALCNDGEFLYILDLIPFLKEVHSLIYSVPHQPIPLNG